MKIELFGRRNWIGQLRHYFRVRGDNGQTMLQSEGYSRRIDMLSTVHSLRNGLHTAEMVDGD